MIKMFSLPMPPSINHYYGHSVTRDKKPLIYILPRGKWYRQQVYFLTCNKISKINNPFFGVPLYVHIKFYPRNEIRDIDNPLKCLFDSLTKANIWKDDRYIRKCFLEFSEKPNSKNYLEISICNDLEEFKSFIIEKLFPEDEKAPAIFEHKIKREILTK